MEFIVNIDIENDAFRVYPEREVASHLKMIARQVMQGLTYDTIMDSNGNTVGRWEFKSAMKIQR